MIDILEQGINIKLAVKLVENPQTFAKCYTFMEMKQSAHHSILCRSRLQARRNNTVKWGKVIQMLRS
jgi:hypothetical protein